LYTYKATVERVIDGDTLECTIDLGLYTKTRQKLRLRAIDAPELRTTRGQAAKAFVDEKLSGASEIVVKTYKSDKYDRYLADIFVMPGETDFGKVGFMTCSDSWFTDVAEVVALRGADVILFPNLGYDRALMHARSLDNCINIVASSRAGGCGVWDAAGREVLSASFEISRGCAYRDVVKTQVDGLDILMVTLDLNVPLTGGSRSPSIRTKRYGGNQSIWLEEQIWREKDRWWVD